MIENPPRRLIFDRALVEAREYWHARLRGVTGAAAIPADAPGAGRAGAREEVSFAAPAEVGEAVLRLTRGDPLLAYATVLAALKLCLYRYHGPGTVTVGTPPRPGPGAAPAANVLAVADEVHGGLTFRELLGAVRRSLLEAYAHQAYPFPRLLRELELDGAGALLGITLRLEGLHGPLLEMDGGPRITLWNDGAVLRGTVSYPAGVYLGATVERFAGHLLRALAAGLERPAAALDTLDVASPAERRRVLEEWNATDRPFPRGTTLHGWFEAQVARTPAAVAVECDGQVMSYAELNARADRLARRLAGMGVGPERLVGVCLERSAELVVALLAVLKAGGAYLPLDPAYPPERLRYMWDDSGARVLLTRTPLLGRLGDGLSSGGGALLCLDAAAPDDEDDEDDAGPPSRVAPENLAYVIYTSGSTGRPKGTLVQHASVVNYLHWFAAEVMDGQACDLPLLSRLSFDALVRQLYPPLLSGGRVWLPTDAVAAEPAALARALDRPGRLGVGCVPSLWSLLLEVVEAGGAELRGLDRLMLGGEALTPELLARTRARFPGVAIWNHYGPTEATVNAAAGRVDGARVTLGRPLSNVRAYVLDAGGRLALLGAAGELYVGGAAPARGYLGRPGLTAERFVPDPFGPAAGGRLYRTGDRVRWSDGGELEHLGRMDEQVKVRGYRVEPGEIEALLAAHPGVRAAAVAARDVGAGSVLVAYVVGMGAEPDPRALRAYLAERLPDYMVPGAFVALDRLPLTPSGKVDRRALPAPAAGGDGGAPHQAPRTPAEVALAGIWSEVLGLDRVGAEESFFELGGHSLVAMRVVTRVRQALGVELPLRAVFEAQTIRLLAARVEALHTGGVEVTVPPVVPVSREGDIPLSFAQQRLWFIDRLEPGSAAYNIPVALRLRGALDGAALARALTALVGRHEVLRTTFAEGEGGEAVQVIHPAARVPLPVVDLSAMDAFARDGLVERLVGEEASRPFDLARGPVLRCALMRLGPADAVALFTLHHIAGDAWSTGILVREVSALYAAFARGGEAGLPDLPVQYADYAVWQRGRLEGEVLETQLAYWRGRLAGAAPVLELPLDHPRPALAGGRAASHAFELAPGLARAVRELARREGATPYITLLAAWQALLARYAGTDDVVVGTPVAGRTRVEVENLVGFFVNTLVIRTSVEGEPTFRDLVGRVRDGVLEAQAHQDLPFERLVDALEVERSLAHTPVFQVTFTFTAATRDDESLRLGEVEIESLSADSGTAKFDLVLAMSDAGESLSGSLEYRADLFDTGTMERMTRSFARLLEQVAADPDSPVSAVELLDPAERRQVLETWNATAATIPAGPIHHHFEAQAARTPLAVAIESGDGVRWTYAELNVRSNRIAHRLIHSGAGTDTRVALLMERSADTVAAIYGVLKAGAAYVPIDPGYPTERISHMLADAAAPIILTQSSLAGGLGDAGVMVIALDVEDLSGEDDSDPGIDPDPESLAYVIYTSGSTGTPKGAAIPHRALANHMAWMQDAFPLAADDRVLQKTPVSFDASVWEFHAPLLSGATLVLAAPDAHRDPALMVREIRERAITILQVTPTLLGAVLDEPELTACDSLRRLFAGGEALPPGLVRSFHASLPSVEMVNLYGPTEVCIDATSHVVDATGATVPIGRPVHNTRVYVLDARMLLAGVGIPGELYLGGAQVGRGYLGRAARTAGSFVPDPFAAEPGGRLYRTGDRARWRPDGVLEHLGRIDFQVKVRGVRIEPGEIEGLLREHADVRDAVVVARDDGPGGTWLVAYVVGAAEPDALRAHLAARLPEAMVPGAFVAMDALPLTPGGKVDRRALPEPARGGGPLAYEPPHTPAEEALAGIWGEVLGLERVSVEDNFFALGGHSLIATRVVSRVRQSLGVELPLRAVFEAQTIRLLAPRVEALHATGVEAWPLVPVSREGDIPLSFAQQRLWFIDQLEPGSAAYNIPVALRLRGALHVSALSRALDEVVGRHEVLRTTFAEGEGGEAVQVIHPAAPIPLPVVDLSAMDEPARDALVERLVAEEAARSFDLARGPVLRCALVRLGPGDAVVLFTLHHIAGDAWSTEILVREVSALYAGFARGEAVALAPLPVQYADYAAWQRGRLEGEVLETQLAYWRGRLAGAAPVLELPLDHPRPVLAGGRGASHDFDLAPRLALALRELARREGATPYMILLAAWQALLARYTGIDDVVVGTPVAGRTRVEVENLVGFFVNTLVIRTGLEGEPTFRDLVGRVRDGVLEAQAHQDLPFERLVDALEVERSLAHTPVFQVTFTLQQAHAGGDGLRLGEVEIESLSADSGTAKFDLALSMSDTGEVLSGSLGYRADLFDVATMERMTRSFVRLLERVVAEPDARVSAVELLEPAERRQVVEEWNATAATTATTATTANVPVHRQFEAQSERTPHAVAVEWDEGQVAYGELNARANRIARRLIRGGAGTETRVAILMERSAEMVAAIYGVLKAGAAYVPIDPGYPTERISHMLADAAAPIILTQSSLAGGLGDAGVMVIVLDVEDLSGEDDSDPGIDADPESLAYVIYTSGSTGTPKGAAIPHRALANHMGWMQDAFPLAADDRVLQKTLVSFDASVWEFHAPLLAGATLVLAAPDAHRDPALLVREVRERAITILQVTPTLLGAVLDEPELAACDSLRRLFAGGEALPPGLVRRFQEAVPSVEVVNLYGPTEVCIDATSHVADATGFTGFTGATGATGITVPIGRPVHNTRAYVLDARMLPVGVGIPGELYLGGAQVGRGYLGRAARTAGNFVPDPFAAEPGGRLYRTGDRARWRPDGVLEHLGRIDFQVKVRGVRIEPGEIEGLLREHADVRDAVVVARDDGPAGTWLVAYVVGAAEPDELRAHLAARLPEAMVPGAFVAMDALPLTPGGKVDRRSLPEPARGGGPIAYEPPRTPAEEALAGIWGEVLGLERVSVEDNFFALGGHSLIATRVVSRVRQSLGVELPLRAVFEAQTIRLLAPRVEALHAMGVEAWPLVPVSREGDIPLSFAQQRLWFIDQLEPGSAAYNIPVALRLRGELNAKALSRALDEVIRRHEVLRTTLAEGEGGEAVQVIHPAAPIPLPVVDLSAVDEPARDGLVERLVGEEAARSFDLARGPLIRSALLRLAEDDHAVLLTLHHAVSDGWSMEILQREVTALYDAFVHGSDADLPDLPVQYADYAVWQRRWLEGEVLERQLAYWRGRLAGAPAVLELPTDRPRPPRPDGRGAAVGFGIAPELASAVRELGRREGATPYITLLAAWQALLARYTGTGDVVVGTPVAGRTRLETEGLIGFFVNTLVIRTSVEGEPTFRQLVGRVRDGVLEAQAHQDLPFERLVDALEVERSLAHTPVFQVTFTFTAATRGDESLRLGEVEIGSLSAESGTAKFDLALSIGDAGEGMAGTLAYRTELFDDATAERMGRHLVRLLEQVVAEPDARVSAVELLDPAERRQVVEEWNATAAATANAPADSIHRGFEAQAARTPGVLAVQLWDGARWTYAELNARANRIARRLIRSGAGTETRVAILMERSAEMVAAIYGVLKAGAAYVPIDPGYPAERISHMLADAASPIILTHSSLADGLGDAGVMVIALDTEDLSGEDDSDPGIDADPESLAYVIYTSGSTGTPKGAAIPHRALANHMAWMQDAFPLAADDRVLQKTPVSFDASVWEFHAPLLSGATLVLAAPDAHRDPALLVREIRERAITILQVTPTLLGAVLDEPELAACDSLRRLFAGGEALPLGLVRRFREALPSVEVVNLYGPTEVCIDATSHVVEITGATGATGITVPIGRPVHNTRAYVLDARMTPVGVGIPGELYLGGAQVGRGYLGLAARTAGSFVPDPFAAEPGGRLYRTGDRARWRPDGVLEHLGRIDFQVKVRGVRIEPGEIEGLLREHADVRAAVVVARNDGPGGTWLVAYVVGAAEPDALRAHLAARLPEAMVPGAFVAMDALPLTPGGKVDRRSLPEPARGGGPLAYEPPRTPAEEALAGIWGEVLGLERVSVEDNFFALGGHSLIATRVVSRVRQSLGVELPLRAVFEAQTIRLLAPRVEALHAMGVEAWPLVPVSREGDIPLSFAQQRLWFIDQLEPGSAAYNIPVALRLHGALDLAALSRALTALVGRHEVLRTTFAEGEGGEAVQVIHPAAPVPLPVVDLSAVDEPARDGLVERLVGEEAARPFDLARGPVLRCALLRLGPGDAVVLFTLHHIAGDAWSTEILVREVSALYAAFARGGDAGLAGLPALPVQYADYAAWQRGRLEGEVLETQLAYWRGRLAGAPAVLELPTDHPRPALAGGRGASHDFDLAPGLALALRELARREGATPYITLLAAWQALLARYTGTDDVVVGTPVAGRTRIEVENLVGFFVNTLVIRTSVEGEPTFRDLVGRVRDGVLEAQAHQDLPFERLVDALEVERSLAHTPVFQVTFTLQQAHAGGDGLRLGEVEIESLSADSGTAKFDLALSMSDTGEALSGSLGYRADLFDPATMERMTRSFVRLLERVVAEPDARVSTVELLDVAERRMVLEEWNATAAPVPADSIHRGFEAQAARTPGALAVESWDGARWTYAELNARANHVARRLIGSGAGTDTRVAILMERSAEMVAAIYGVIKAGAAYVPIDPGYPAERISHMLADAAAPIILTQSSLAGGLGDAGVMVIVLDVEDLSGEDDSDPGIDADAESLAYVIYTSGSTGTPKGAAIPHRALANHMGWMQDAFPLAADDRVLQKTPFSFDASVWEFHAPLLSGATLVLAAPDAHRDPALLVREVRERAITILQVTPTLLGAVLDEPELPACDSLRRLFAGGEALPPGLVRRFHASLPSVEVVNLYGPTEVCIDATSHVVDATGATVPIGRPVHNTQAYVLDARMLLAGVGIPGELYLGGAQVGRGYLGLAARTAGSFVPDPFAAEPGGRLYRTGDRARWRPDGVLEHLGRIDFQVKVRGVRIEPGEIEGLLREHADVRDAVVVARDDGPAGTWLVAYVVGAAEPDALRAHLAARLPEAMVPGAFVAMDALPLTPGGKVDRRSLPEPARGGGPLAYEPPRTPAEEVLAGIWGEVLGLERVSVEDNFFSLGGHSLIATRVVSRVRQSLGVELPLRAVFESQTIRLLAARVEALRAAGGGALEAQPLVPVSRGGELRLSFAQQRLWFIDQLEPGSAAYNIPVALRLGGALHVSALSRALDEVVRRHEVLRTTFAEGEGGEAVQVIHPAAPVPLPVVDLSAVDEPARDGLVERLVGEEASRPFDLARGPVLRCALVRLGPGDAVVLFTLHHIAGDAWSTEILVREVSALYAGFARGEAVALAPLPVQYADYAAWQRGRLEGEVLETQLAYWRERLAGAAPVLELPTDHPRPALAGGRGASHDFELAPGLALALRELARREGATPYITLLAAWQALLARYTSTDDVVVGTPVAGRTRIEVENLVGFFVNTLVIRTGLEGEPTFRELVGRVRDGVLEAQAHQDLPFERLVDTLEVERSLAHTPVFQVTFTLQQAHAGGDGLRLGEVEIESLSADSGTAKFDLALSMSDTGEVLSGSLGYRADLFDVATMERMTRSFVRLLERVVAEPDSPVSAVELLDPAERRQVVEEWNATAAATANAPADSIHRGFEEQAARTPGALAVESGEGRWTYAELNARANRIARRLIRGGAGTDTRVALLMERSADTVAAMYGVLKAGAAYVPIDPGYPAERISHMLADAAASIILTHSSLADGLGDAGVMVIALDVEDLSGEDDSDPGIDPVPESLAYVIYTSGSTGTPKGAAIPHRALANHMAWMQDTFPLAADDRVLQKTPVSFDASVWEFHAPLLAGATLVLAAPDAHRDPALLVREVRERTITILQVTPTLLGAVLDEPDLPGCDSLRRLFAGGEALPPGLVRSFRESLPSVEVVNLYGPTEVCIDATSHVVDATGATVPIGRPVHNTRAYVLDARMLLAGVGIPGELYLGGAQVGRGYLGHAARTAGSFVPDPFAAEPGGRLYRTGDRARWRPDGLLEHLGRIDFQVKVRGVRIEPGEIEGLLREHADVRAAVVVARDDGPAGTWLVAYVVGAAEPDALRAHLAARLPEAMVPGAFVAMDALPLTPGGKVDRRSLPEPARGGGPLAYEPPRTPAEEALAGIWGEVLGLGRVSVEDNFFALGGHSLIATRVVSRVRQALGVELPLRAVFEAQTIRLLAPRVEALHAMGVEAWPLVPVSREGDIPLSFAQQRLWFIDQLEPGSAAYNIPVALRLGGALDAKALSRALDEVVRRHEVLRTTVGIGADGEPVQVIHPTAPIPLPLIDLSAVDEPARGGLDERLAGEEAARPFDLARGPLLRAALLRTGEDDHAVLLTLHHAVSDGWSMEILQREVTALYAAFARGGDADLPDLPVQYADYAVWQRRWLEGEVLETQLAYWRGRLAGAPAVLELPTDRPRPPRPDGRGAAVGFGIAPELASAVRELGRREGATPYITLLAAWQALLARYTGTGDVVVGTPVAGRTRLETEGLIGFFVNTLVIRTGLEGEPTFRQLVGRVRDGVLEAQAHQDLPFERLVDALEVERSLAHTPVFQVTFTFAAATRGDDALRLGDVEIAALEAGGGTAKFDLALSIGDAGEGMAGTLAYRTELFDDATAERMGRHLVRLLEHAVAAPDSPVSAVELLDPAERRQVLEEWNTTAAPTADVPVHRQFEAQAERTPHAVAVEWDEGQVAYGELNARANELACRLRRVGVGPETVVGLCLRRSPELVLASLAVLKAGGAYLPADPDAPAERLRYLLADSGARVVLTHAVLREQVEEAAGAATTVFALHPPGTATGPGLVDEEGPGAAPGTGAPSPGPHEGGEAAGAEALAYVIYTSGSTGRPKGVMVSHGSLANLVAWHLEAFAVTEADHCTQVASPGFDAAVWEVWPPLCAGARLCIVPEAVRAAPEALRDWMVERGVSVAFLPTPLAEGALAVEWPGEGSPRLVLTGGDRLAGRPAPGLPWALVNNYGPTENTVVSTSGAVAPGGRREARAPSIGRPVHNTRAYVLDAALRPVPAGLPGELCVGGAGVARGYLRRPALTAGAFVPDPFTTAPGGRLYRTGDRVRWQADGELEFLGRVDFQVKVRGHRVEPGEIEGALLGHPGVREAVVVAREDTPGDTRLAAYVVGAAGPAPNAAELRRHLTGRLPRYMVPSSFVALDALPLGPNGKVDRAALPALAPVAGERAYVAPRDAQELEVVRAFEELLGVAPVGARDDFFALGGHSLLVVRLLSVLETRTGVRLPVQAAFTAGTPEGFARLLRELGSGRDEPLLVPIHRGGARRPLFLVHAAGGNVLSYATLARRLGPEQPVYALRARGLAAGEEPHGTLRSMAAEYVQAIRAAQPRGPYQVAGWSLGGVVALEMARQLEAAGERVSILATLDSELPGPALRGWTDPAILLEQFALHLGLPAGLGRAHADGSALAGTGTGLPALLDEARGLDLLPPDLGEAELERMFAVFQSNVRAFVDYLPVPVAAPIALLVAGAHGEERAAAQAAAWRRVAGGGLHLRTVAGDHFTLLNDPNAEETAGALSALLEPFTSAPAEPRDLAPAE